MSSQFYRWRHLVTEEIKSSLLSSSSFHCFPNHICLVSSSLANIWHQNVIKKLTSCYSDGCTWYGFMREVILIGHLVEVTCLLIFCLWSTWVLRGQYVDCLSCCAWQQSASYHIALYVQSTHGGMLLMWVAFGHPEAVHFGLLSSLEGGPKQTPIHSSKYSQKYPFPHVLCQWKSDKL